MLRTIILLTASPREQCALGKLLKIHNPSLSFRNALTLNDLHAIETGVLREARLIGFATGVIVPHQILDTLGHGAYNFHPGPPHYPGWAPAHFAIYDGAHTFGATMHEMAALVDSGAIVGVESFDVPADIGVNELERIAYLRMAHLFWRNARDIACLSERLPILPISWSGTKSTQRMYREHCEIPTDIDAPEFRRRLRAFSDDFRAIPLTVTLHGIRFQHECMKSHKPSAPQVEAPPLALD